MLSLASHILDSKAGRFEPSEFKDEFETELRKLVRRKAAGKPIAYAEPVEPSLQRRQSDGNTAPQRRGHRRACSSAQLIVFVPQGLAS